MPSSVSSARRLLVALGDATDVRTRGGSPYFLGQAGLRAGFLHEVGALDITGDRRARWLWNAGRLLSRGERGGYQFSKGFAERVFRQAGLTCAVDEVISQFPLFPPAGWLGAVSTVYYIDATLKQNFEAYGLGARVGRGMQRAVLAREQARYEAADRVIAMCHWAAQSVVEDYGVSADKVHVVPGGANLDEDALRAADAPGEPPPLEPLRLGFVGKDFRRKNLQFILRVAEALVDRGIPAQVLAAGFPVAAGPQHPLLEAWGFLDKWRDPTGFVDFMQQVHFGCLFSYAEASPRSNLEFLRLGIPVITWDVGGMADTVPQGLGEVFPPDTTAESVATWLQSLIGDPARYAALRQRAYARRQEVGWPRAIEQFQSIWSGSSAYRYGPRERAHVR